MVPLAEAISFLDSLQGGGIRPGLERMLVLLAAADSPERTVPIVIVAGTNGKGSTSATLASILQRSGYRTGLYTSPHLVRLNERWRIDGVDMSDDDLIATVEKLRALVRRTGVTPTYFEALTMLAFLYFPQRGCEVIVLEVGMGGRLDATNVTSPLASLITPVALDHCEYLGSTLSEIASEKAGVIHATGIAVTSNRNAEVLAVIASRCAAVSTTLHVLSAEVVTDGLRTSSRGVTFRFHSPDGEYELSSPLCGDHQIENVSLAVRAAELLRAHFPEITPASIRDGVAGTAWRGRMEHFRIQGRLIVVDGGHNPHAAEAVARYVTEQLPGPRTLVFAIMEDKDVELVCGLLFPLFDRIVLTVADPVRGAAEARLRLAAGDRPMQFEATTEGAFAAAMTIVNPVTVVCGSLYLAGDAVAYFDRMQTASASDSSSSETAAAD